MRAIVDCWSYCALASLCMGEGCCMHCLDGGLILVDHCPQILARADCCSPCVRPIFGLILGSYCQDVSRFFFRRPGRFCARCRGSLGDILNWRLFRAWQVVGDWQRRMYPPSIEEVYTRQRQDFLLWASLCYNLPGAGFVQS